MGKSVNRVIKTPADWKEILDKRFSYLPREQRDKVLRGDDFVKVPAQELKRLRIDAYPYLM